MTGCTAPQNRALSLSPAPSATRVELSDTPFFPQSAYQCGPAALATVLVASGLSADPETLTAQVYLPERKGSLQVEMLATARRNGALAVVIEPALTALLQTVADGYPVAILQDLGPGWMPRWHYAVVVGYDLDSSTVVLRSGTTRRLVMPMATLERTWSRSGRWGMAALRPGELPSTLPELRYLEAALAFERLAEASQALTAYEIATRRWPDNRLAWLGVGNNAYSVADWPRAEHAFGQAAALPGDAAPALNNLALTLAAQGRMTEAIATAERAVAAGGKFEAVARATLAELRASQDASIQNSPR